MADVDPRRPWLGLDSFAESTRAYFYGRDEEVAELARRIQHKRLTVLFGQSGLGKTSILRAGIVPRLRAAAFCPVYVRVDYGPAAPLPAQQVRMAIEAAARFEGEALPADASLWALLHQRHGHFVDAGGQPVQLLLIFDQFEEIFTLAQGDGGARARAAQFIDELASLAENRPPRALEERIDSDDTLVEQIDFAREDVRVLISLREDYLAHLEGLKTAMPSITQNRMRLAPMTGAQALAAVRLPGAELVSDEVGEAIVRFVAGGADLAHAQIEPSLLSLICRELNEARIGAGRATITLDLLAGSHASILSDFYERAMDARAPAVRAVIEDVLLTESGYRENVAMERIEQLFAAAGADAGALPDLVNRRLLRIEERLDLRRVELTHDVLCSVVRASRDLRQEREARQANERQLAEQKAHVLATRKRLVRTRQVAIGSGALAVAAIVAFGFAWRASEQAASAERAAEATRAAAASARTQAELLIGYLNDDFARQLEPVARKDLVERLNQRTLGYYDSLPAVEAGSDSERNQAIAMVRYGLTLRFTSRLADSGRYLSKAVAILEARRRKGDASEATAVALAEAYLGQRRLDFASFDFPRALAHSTAAIEVLKPWAYRSGAAPATRHLYAEIVDSRGNVQPPQSALQAIRDFNEALAVLDALPVDAANRDELAVTRAWFVDNGLLLRELAGQPDVEREADRTEGAMLDIIGRDPANLPARSSLAFLLTARGDVARQRGNMVAALDYLYRGRAAYRDLLLLDPKNQNYRGSIVEAAWNLAIVHGETGTPAKALPVLQQGLADVRAEDEDAVLIGYTAILHGLVATEQTTMQERGAERALDAGLALLTDFERRRPEKRVELSRMRCQFDTMAANVALMQGHLQRAREYLRASERFDGDASQKDFVAALCIDLVDEQIAELDLAAGNSAAAAARLARFDAPPMPLTRFDDADRRRQRLLLLALARLEGGDKAAALRIVGPMVDVQRARLARGGGNRMSEVDMAAILLLQARATPAGSAAKLAEARDLLAALPAPMHGMYNVRRWHRLIDAALRKVDKA